MAVSVPPPLFQLKTKLEEDKMVKNKRKSQEPKKLLPSDYGFCQRPTTEQGLDGSDGEAIHSPSSTEGSSLPSPSHPCLTPIMAPKMRFKQEAHKSMSLAEEPEKRASPFRPWDGGSVTPQHKTSPVTMTCNSMDPATLTSQSAAMLLAAKYQSISESEALSTLSRVLALTPTSMPHPSGEPEQDEPLALVMPKHFSGSRESTSSSSSSPSNSHMDSGPNPKICGRQRNYKNMTRERRIEANARERMRVHTITAAFERLQSVIPTTEEFTKSSSQKLSKLAVIKIATSYISMLSSMLDSNGDNKESCDLTIQSCVQECLELIISETKPRRKCE